MNRTISEFPFYSLLLLSILLSGCAGSTSSSPPPRPNYSAKTEIPTLGFTIQVGAFAKIDNAVRLTTRFQRHGLDAYYFIEQHLYKVRFGNFSTYSGAFERAAQLKEDGLFNDYYIVKPASYVAIRHHNSDAVIRDNLVETAERFIGVPYKWGGESAREGFDCSGLAMVVYKLNGFDLPRNSRQQFKAGRAVSRQSLRQGDLVFFSTDLSGVVTHVGIYKGNGMFIHAPRRGKRIKTARLGSSYFRKRYMGGRRYF